MEKLELTNIETTENSREEAISVWEKTLDELRTELHEQSLSTWFMPIVPIHINEEKIVLQLPSSFFYEWLEQRYPELIRSAINKVAGRTLQLSYIIQQQSYEVEDQVKKNPPVLVSPAQNSQVNQRSMDYVTKINPRFNFSNFIEGDGNKFAKAAALAVAEAPGRTAFNPLVIFGGTGLGKTHLMQAIGSFALSEGTAKKVLYATSEQFTSDFINAISQNKTTEFMSHYRDVDMLLIDDIHFFAKKGKTQEEFFHTFNKLHMSSKQIVLTSDRPLHELRDLEERLLSRFKWGLVVDIQPPDFETRIAILKKRAHENGMHISHDILEYLSANITDSIRELEGALIRITAQASILGTEIDLGLAKSVIKKIGKNVKTAITIEDIMRITAEYFGIQENLLLEKTRKKEIVIARQISMYLAKMLTSHTVKSIGLYFGGRDHTTVLYSVKTVEEQLECDQLTAQHVENIRKKIEQNF
jgi:chromosomal replication initiator protein